MHTLMEDFLHGHLTQRILMDQSFEKGFNRRLHLFGEPFYPNVEMQITAD